MESKGVLKLKDFYVTSDTWFGREQILQIANRKDFKDIKDMNNSLIKLWNKTVKKDDVVFHLGNFAWDPHTAETMLRKLNGKIYFLLGPSDEALLDVYEEFKNAVILEDQILTLPMHDVVLCHYPLSVWNGKDTGTIHIHGHTVFSHKTNLKLENRFNICTDFWNYSPVNYLTLKDFVDA